MINVICKNSIDCKKLWTMNR